MRVVKATKDYRSFGVMFDLSRRDWQLTVSLWWVDLTWEGKRP